MKGFRRNESGGVMILFALICATLFAFIALAVDSGNLYYNKSRIQAAADAAALGAVLFLPSSASATTQAVSLAASNVPASFGTITSSSDVVVGTWNPLSRTFTASATNQNAVKVLTHRTASNGNAVSTFFGGFVAKPTVDVQAQAIAVKDDRVLRHRTRLLVPE